MSVTNQQLLEVLQIPDQDNLRECAIEVLDGMSQQEKDELYEDAVNDPDAVGRNIDALLEAVAAVDMIAAIGRMIEGNDER
jgi:hypothetical protein